MTSSFFKFSSLSLLPFVCLLLFCFFFIPILSQSNDRIITPSLFDSNEFIWPTPGYDTITSRFGPRKAPTGGSSTNHSGIDIGAPTGTNILSVCSGEVNFTGFKGAGRIYHYDKK